MYILFYKLLHCFTDYKQKKKKKHFLWSVGAEEEEECGGGTWWWRQLYSGNSPKKTTHITLEGKIIYT